MAALTLLLNRKLHRLRRMVRRLQQHVWQTHNIFQLFSAEPTRAPLPAPGGWAAGTDLLGAQAWPEKWH